MKKKSCTAGGEHQDTRPLKRPRGAQGGQAPLPNRKDRRQIEKGKTAFRVVDGGLAGLDERDWEHCRDWRREYESWRLPLMIYAATHPKRRRRPLQQDALCLNDTVVSMRRLLQALIGEDMDICTDLAPDLGFCAAGTSELEQVLLNLAINARYAMPYGGRFTIKTMNVELGDREAKEPQLVPDGYVMLEVTGTARNAGSKTSKAVLLPLGVREGDDELALPTVRRIIEQLEGHMWTSLERGGSTSFRIALPRIDEPLAPTTLWVDKRAMGDLVLVVEKEPKQRSLARATLERAGYRVREAESGPEALHLVEDGEEAFDLLLCAVDLPVMTGCDLARRVEILAPSVKVVFLCRAHDDLMKMQDATRRGASVLKKPFSSEELTRLVQTVLGRDEETR